MPKISVIVPVYNTEKYLSQCLDSLLNQTLTDFEVICVNDGATDGSAKILNQYACHDDRVKILTQKNQGLSMARNNGLLQATGDYVYFLDSDDEIHYSTLEIAYGFAVKYEADLVCWEFTSEALGSFHNQKFDIDEVDYKISNAPIFLGTHKEQYRINFNACTKLYKRELLNGIVFIPGIHFEDVPHTFTVLSKYPKTVVINEEFYYYRKNPDSITNRKSNPQQIKDHFTGIKKIYDIYSNAGLSKELSFLAERFIPNILQLQLNRCRHAENYQKTEMWNLLDEQFKWLESKNLIYWKNHKILKCWLYLKCEV